MALYLRNRCRHTQAFPRHFSNSTILRPNRGGTRSMALRPLKNLGRIPLMQSRSDAVPAMAPPHGCEPVDTTSR